MLDLHDISEREYYGSRKVFHRHIERDSDPQNMIFYTAYYFATSWQMRYELEQRWHIDYLGVKNA